MSALKTDENIYEKISALVDEELEHKEKHQIIDQLTSDPALLEKWYAHQLIKDSIHDQLNESLLQGQLHKKISLELENEPAHFVDDAVDLEKLNIENSGHGGWLDRFLSNRIVSGVSVAASVMFVTLFAFQLMNAPVADQGHKPVIADKSAQTQVPVNYVAGNDNFENNGNKNKPGETAEYTWIEADPNLSRQIKQYVNEHESYSSTISTMEAKISTASFHTGE